jgi:uncharacterized repeat protein (TIGR04052 family)
MSSDTLCRAFARLVLGGATLVATACDDSEPQRVTLDFRAVVDGVPFACGERYEGIGTTEAAIEPLDFRLYVYGFELLDADGERHPATPVDDGRWQRDGFALVDFEDGTGACATGSPATHTTVELESDERIAVAGVAFRLGLPPESNHLDAATAPPPLNEPGLWWSWRGGYKYVRADVLTEAGAPFFFHLGSTACEGDPTSGFSCGFTNIAEVVLPALDPRTEQVAVDLARLYDGVDLLAPVDPAKDSVAGCMAVPGDPECPAMFEAVGLPFQSQAPLGVEQRMFGVEARP